jgi:hypothetical protein
MIKNTKLRSEGVKRARELIYTAERQASRDVGLPGLRLKPGSSQRSGLAPYLNGKTTFYKASDLWLKAINKGNTKIKPGKGTSKANQNTKKDKRVVHYNFKIFVVSGKRQYNNSKKEKQPNKYELDKELSKQTFIKVNKTINN